MARAVAGFGVEIDGIQKRPLAKNREWGTRTVEILNARAIRPYLLTVPMVVATRQAVKHQPNRPVQD